MAVSNINAIINKDIHKVWDIVFAVEKYSEWRSDLSKTEIINEKQFIEYTKDGYATTFSITTICLLYTSPSPRDAHESRMPSSA